MMNHTRTSDGARVSGIAREAAGKIGETARDLRDGAADFARASAESVGDAMTAAQGQAGRYASAARRRVARKPFESALIAAAIGAAAAALAMAISRGRRDTD